MKINNTIELAKAFVELGNLCSPPLREMSEEERAKATEVSMAIIEFQEEHSHKVKSIKAGLNAIKVDLSEKVVDAVLRMHQLYMTNDGVLIIDEVMNIWEEVLHFSPNDMTSGSPKEGINTMLEETFNNALESGELDLSKRSNVDVEEEVLS